MRGLIDDALQQLGNDFVRVSQAGLVILDEPGIPADVDDDESDALEFHDFTRY